MVRSTNGKHIRQFMNRIWSLWRMSKRRLLCHQWNFIYFNIFKSFCQYMFYVLYSMFSYDKKISKNMQRSITKYGIYGLRHSKLNCWRPCENTLLLFFLGIYLKEAFEMYFGMKGKALLIENSTIVKCYIIISHNYNVELIHRYKKAHRWCFWHHHQFNIGIFIVKVEI